MIQSYVSRVLRTGVLPLALVGCASAPTPPSVDDSVRRPINTPAAIAAQRCQGELRATTIELAELRRESDRDMAAAAQERARALARCDSAALAAPPPPSQVFVWTFAVGGSEFAPAGPEAQRMVVAAKQAPLVVVRGRTDARKDSPAETALARRRAESAAEFLRRNAGVADGRMRVTWQGAGDPLAVPASRDDDRRVEVEVYAVAPAAAVVARAN